MSTLHVICKIADSEYALPADEVQQMESFSGATPVPGAPPYVLGLVQIRQQIFPVLDLRRRIGLPAIAPSLESRVVVLNSGTRRVGIVVDSAREVREIASEQFRPTPEVVARQSSGFIKSIAQLEDRIVFLLDTPKVVGEEVFHG